MSNTVQDKINDSRTKKGKEKAQEIPTLQNEISDSMLKALNKNPEKRPRSQKEYSDSKLKKGKKRSDVWNYFVEEEQPDGTVKAKCLNCEKLEGCDSKNGTSHLLRHPCYKNRKKDAKTTPSYSSEYHDQDNNREISRYRPSHSEYDHQGNQEHFVVYDQQNNQQLSGFQNNHLGYDQQRDQAVNNLEYNQHVDPELLGYENNDSGYDLQNNQRLSGFQNNNLGYDHQRDQAVNNLEYNQHVDPELLGYENNDSGYDPQKNRKLFFRMIIDNRDMLEHVENPFLKGFAKFLQPLYIPVTQRDVEEDCLTFYDNEKSKLKDKISKLTSRVSLSFEWCGYNPKDTSSIILCVAAHFIDNDYKLVKIIIGIFVAHLLLDKMMCPKIDEVLNDWGLGDKLFAGTATFINNNNSIAWFSLYMTLPEMCLVRCFLNFIKLAAQGLCLEYTIYSSIIDTIEDLIHSPEKMSHFNQIAEEHNLPPKLKFAHNEGVLGSELNLLNDACTYKSVFSAFIDIEDVKWSNTEQVVDLLNAINDAIVKVSSHECPTSNLLLQLVFQINDILVAAYPHSSSIRSYIGRWLKELDEYLIGCNKIILIASLLDPRFKLKFLNRCFGKIIDNMEDFLKFFDGLYDTYQSDSAETSAQRPEAELNIYLKSSGVEEKDANLDVLDWWKHNENEYPILSRMARDILAIPISSSLSSGAEPMKKIIEEIFASTIDTEMCKVLACCNNWLTSHWTAGKFEAGIKNIVEKRIIGPTCPESSNKGNSFVYDQKECHQLLAKLVISCNLPFHFVNNTWFIEWAKTLQPSYTPVDAATIRIYCLRFCQTERKWLQNDFNVHIKRGCFSTYTCGDTRYRCIHVMTHYVDNEFNLVRRMIGVTTENDWKIQNIERCIAGWGLFRREVLAFTIHIQGSKFLYAPIQLDCIVDGLFNELSEAVCENFDSLFCSSRKMIKYLADKPMNYKIDFKLDNSTTWDSTLNMLYGVLKNKNFYDAIEDHDVKQQFASCGGWSKVECVVKILKPIYEAVIILTAAEYPTSNLCLKIIFEILDVISHVAYTRSNDCGKLELRLSELVGEYFKNCNKILLVASLLDPRFKMIYLERCYEEHIFKREEIDKYIRELYENYESKIKFKGGLSHGVERQLRISELERYLQKGVVTDVDQFDVLRWWNDNKSNYPILSRMARHILAIPVSSVSSEVAFYNDPDNRPLCKFEKNVKQLGLWTAEALMCSHNWLSDARYDEGKQEQNRAAIDSVEKHIPPSYKWRIRVCDIWCITFLKYCWSVMWSEEIIAIGDSRLTVEKLHCLMHPIDKDGPDTDKWIPDEVLNCYICIINHQTSRSGDVWIHSTFDSRSLESWGRKPPERILPSMISKGHSFLQNKLVFFPIHIQDHWFVMVINALKKEFQILDSMNSLGRPYETTTLELRLGIQRCIDAALFSEDNPLAWTQDSVLNWPISVISDLPQQKDGYSCGLFALKYMQFWDGSKLDCNKFTQDDIDLFRKRLAGELIFSDLNKRKDIQVKVTKFKIYGSYDDSDESSIYSDDEGDESDVNSNDEGDESGVNSDDDDDKSGVNSDDEGDENMNID